MHSHKSSRHSKITGELGEYLVLYYLSKIGFECARIDHTGIDLIARNNLSQELMGISVKTRSRIGGTEGTPLNIPASHLPKAEKACSDFGCVPYFAVVVDQNDRLYIFIIGLSKLKELFPSIGKVYSWKMKPGDLDQYHADPDIMILEFSLVTNTWFRDSKVIHPRIRKSND